MSIHCLVFELRRNHDEYRQFFKHLDAQKHVDICQNCRLFFSHNSAESLQKYFENFIYPDDTLFIAEIGRHWTLNKNFEAAEWLRELQALTDNQQHLSLHNDASKGEQAP